MDLKQACCTHATANAHADHHIANASALAFQQGVADQSGARHAKRVTNGNGAAVDVEFGVINAQGVSAMNNLAGKGFVDFPQTNV